MSVYRIAVACRRIQTYDDTVWWWWRNSTSTWFVVSWQCRIDRRFIFVHVFRTNVHDQSNTACKYKEKKRKTKHKWDIALTTHSLSTTKNARWDENRLFMQSCDNHWRRSSTYATDTDCVQSLDCIKSRQSTLCDVKTNRKSNTSTHWADAKIAKLLTNTNWLWIVEFEAKHLLWRIFVARSKCFARACTINHELHSVDCVNHRERTCRICCRNNCQSNCSLNTKTSHANSAANHSREWH